MNHKINLMALYNYKVKNILMSLLLSLVAVSATAQAAEELYSLTGFELITTFNGSVFEDTELIVDIELPDDDLLVVPYLFEGDVSTAAVSASFNGSPIEIINADYLIADELDYLLIDVAAFRTQTGELKIKLSATGATEQTLFVIKFVEDDTDEDGLADAIETGTGIYVDDSDRGTDPNNSDTDADGLPDGYEVITGLDPLSAADGLLDADADGLSRGEEYVLGTDYSIADTDGDGVLDGDEGPLGLDPLNSDSDGDGLLDGAEGPLGLDPLNSDSDNDGLPDGAEGPLGLDPLNSDSDSDGMLDGWEVNHSLDPLVDDSALDADGDGLPNGYEATAGLDPQLAADALLDVDEDGLTNIEEYNAGSDIANPDTDGDGLADGWEVAYNLSAVVANDTSVDSDGDQLSLLEEFEKGTDPTNEDTDADGVNDGSDDLPLDVSESVDTDLDGIGNNADTDDDNDGVDDASDAFPLDAAESVDTDGDGVGDNSDAFPNDGSEWLDTDGDGAGDNGDAFPDDGNEWLDTDGDGVGDNSDAYPNDPTKTVAPLIADLSFTDLNLESCVHDFAVANFMVYVTDMDWLACHDSLIIQLDGLSQLTSLNAFYADGNDISDLSALTSMNQLQFLSLGGNLINDISPLASLQLYGLALWDNLITDLTPLQNQFDLTGLYLSNNGISSLTALSLLTALDYVYVQGNAIPESDLQAFAPMVATTFISDIGRPEILNFQLNPADTVNLETGAQQVYISLEIAGIANDTNDCFVGLESTTTDGWFDACDQMQSLQLSLHEQTARGEWQAFVEFEHEGQMYEIGTPALEAMGFDATIEIVGAGVVDITAPEVTDLTISSAVIDVTSAPAQIDVELSVIEGESGYYWSWMELMSEDGSQYRDMDNMDAFNTTLTALFSNADAVGVWFITNLEVSDKAGNVVEFTYADLEQAGFEVAFEIINNNLNGDSDSDGVIDSLDAFPLDATETTDTDSDGIGNNADINDDNDGYDDAVDNCTLLVNDNQLDLDADGFGNLCDADFNNDNIVNSLDIGLFKAGFFTAGPQITDINGDNIVNSLDLGLFKKQILKQPGPSGLNP